MKARSLAEGYQSPLISSDNSPFTLAEHLIAFLNAFDEASLPPEVWAESLLEFLRALPRIAESLSAQAAYTEQLDRIIELWQETNRHLSDIKDRLGGKT